VYAPTTVVWLPSTPWKVQVAPPAELMDVMLDLSSAMILASTRSGDGSSVTAKRKRMGGEWRIVTEGLSREKGEE